MLRILLIALTVGLGILPASSAQLASRPVEDWIKGLESPERIAGLKVDEVIARLQLKPGNVVADLGAGSGVFAAPIARIVGPGGKVYAVEIDANFFPYIERKAKEQNLTNIRTILGKPIDPLLPAADVDLALLHDVLHHVADRPGYLKNAVRYLKPDGRLAIVDLVGPRGPHSDDPKLQVTKSEVSAWMAEIGFVPAEDVPLFEEKWYVIYRRK
jgi:ubiquinone/menaquinone biosynthesis C-methylase UbiE